MNSRPAALRRVSLLLLGCNVVLAAAVALWSYPPTQDGPAHLYAAHVLRSLARDPQSPFVGVFTDNLRFTGNSLFFHLARETDGILGLEALASWFLFLCMAGLPVSVWAYASALRSDRGTSSLLPDVSAIALSIPMAYNYFVYRGFFNYMIAVPLGLATLAAFVAFDADGRSTVQRASLGTLALIGALLTALAHPAGTAFLLGAVLCASLNASWWRRGLGAACVAVLVAFVALGPATFHPNPPPTVFSSFPDLLMRFGRALGITHSYLEGIFVLPTIPLVLYAAWRGLRAGLPRLAAVWQRWGAIWPLIAASGLMLIYWITPLNYGGAAGLNERIPLFAVLLLLPFVPLSRRLAWLLCAGFLAFAALTLYTSRSNEARVEGVREAVRAAGIPRGARVYPIALDPEFGSRGGGLAFHLVADAARRGGHLTNDVFCQLPGHAIRCVGAKLDHSNDPFKALLRMDLAARAAALSDPNSRIRTTCSQIAKNLENTDYVVVIENPELDDKTRAALGDYALNGAQRMAATQARTTVYSISR